MMPALSVPIGTARAYVRVARTDSLVRNSLFMMTSTVATGLLGYVFWIIAARVFSSADIGVASAVISLCSTLALLTYLGPAAMLIERLHAYERSTAWTALLTRMCVATAVVTGVAAAAIIPIFAHSKGYGTFFSAAGPAVLAVIGAVSWTVVNMYGSAFIAARRAGGLLAVNGIASLLKVALVVPLCAAGLGAPGIVVAWVASTLIVVALGAGWLLPGLGLGRPPQVGRHRQRTAAARPPAARPPASSPPVSPPPAGPLLARPPAAGLPPASPQAASSLAASPLAMTPVQRPAQSRTAYLGHLIGQHLTSVGGQVTPLILPILVVLRLGVRPNAYFYITWMIGSVFFMVSPSISNALFAESVRVESGLRATVSKAFRVTSFLLLPAIVVMAAGGKLILGIFGQPYVTEGYGLLMLLALSSLPDAVSNIAVAVCRATDRLGYSVAINLGILVITVVTAWFLMPSLGLLGVGIGWLGAQAIGAIASVPAFLHLDAGAAA